MDGIINLYKPLGLTSARALDHVRRITGQRKSGHAGALDPLAEGVLVVCLGRATKLVELVMNQPKVYRARARLHATSASFDAECELTPVAVEQPPPAEAVCGVLAGLEGVIQQVPPAISAVKVDGRPAYRLSRAGRPPELKARPVTIYWTRLISYAWPEVVFEVACGRGTYIRALIRDIGTALGTGGYLTALVRTAVGALQVQSAWTLERLAEAGDPAQYVIPFEDALALLREIRHPTRPSGVS